MASQGLLLVVSGPSGAGKGTICKELRAQVPEIQYSVSATTRSPRSGEIDGQHYFFVSKEQFEDMIANNGLLEWAKVYSNYYGTPIDAVRESIDRGQDIILEIDIQGALQIKEKFPQGIFIFVAPPSLSELRRRIVTRGTDAPEKIEERMNCTQEELTHIPEYDYIVVNDELEQAVAKVKAIIVAEKCKPSRTEVHIP